MNITGQLGKIKESLQNENLCILPTDTILGLFSTTTDFAVRKIFSTKKRSLEKPLAIFVPNIESIAKYGIENEASIEFARNNLPGAYTILLEATDFAKKSLSPLLISSDGKIGIRIPNNADILEITKSVIICGTSVNLSGETFATDENIPQEIAHCVEYYLQSKNVQTQMANTPSTIIDFSNCSNVKGSTSNGLPVIIRQ